MQELSKAAPEEVERSQLKFDANVQTDRQQWRISLLSQAPQFVKSKTLEGRWRDPLDVALPAGRSWLAEIASEPGAHIATVHARNDHHLKR